MGAPVTARPVAIIRSTLYCRAPVTSTSLVTVTPARVAVTVHVPVLSGRENLVDPTPFRVVSPSVQVTEAPAQVVTLILALCTPRAAFKARRVTFLFWPAVLEK